MLSKIPMRPCFGALTICLFQTFRIYGEGWPERPWPALPKRLIDIPEKIFHVFQSNRETNQLGSHSRRLLLHVAELLVGGRSGMDHQAARVADIGKLRKDQQFVDELL